LDMNMKQNSRYTSLQTTLKIGFVLCGSLYLLWNLLERDFPLFGLQYPPVRDQNSLQNVFQVYRPPPEPPSHATEILLMDHVFAFSYGKPFIGSYIPPTAPFNTVTMTLTVTSRGRQFDRLALMFLGDVEVFRTSTAEPTANGIIWTYRKDMTAYLSLWRKPQKVIFDLGNLVNDVYTGTFNATLTASFFNSSEPAQTADVILPISSQRSGMNVSSAFNVPYDDARVYHGLPENVTKAIVAISACGQATEEFWYSNVMSPYTDTFLNTTGPLYGFSPFREVQLLIDGYLAGVVWPFPIIFTGGIAPGFWRPIVGIDAFDLREPEIDITPWIPWLTDAKQHEFQIRVVGLDGEGDDVRLSDAVGDYWVVTGKILVFFDDEMSVGINSKAHDVPLILAPDPTISANSSLGNSANGTNQTLSYSLTASRTLVIVSDAGSFVQNLEYVNENVLTSQGVTQSTAQTTSNSIAAINSLNPLLSFSVAALYPLSVNTTIGIFNDESGISIDAHLVRRLEIASTGRPDISLFTLTAGESKLDTTQLGTAHYSSQPNRSYSFGDTTQDFVERSRRGILLVHVEAMNGSVASTGGDVGEEAFVTQGEVPYRSLRGMVGRGPGSPFRLPA
jgi:Peptide N-acetyl-beta-D-glucosaminyl asparaginase amidase A